MLQDGKTLEMNKTDTDTESVKTDAETEEKRMSILMNSETILSTICYPLIVHGKTGEILDSDCSTLSEILDLLYLMPFLSKLSRNMTPERLPNFITASSQQVNQSSLERFENMRLRKIRLFSKASSSCTRKNQRNGR